MVTASATTDAHGVATTQLNGTKAGSYPLSAQVGNNASGYHQCHLYNGHRLSSR
ncbi:hypothetical protein ABC733_03555 [Mangrovibacter sp. SLW1]